MPVADWFPDFLDAHLRRHPRADWPHPAEEPEFFDAWKAAFVRGGLTATIAEAASVALAAAPPPHLGGHLPGLLEAAKVAFREAAAANDGILPGSIDDARKRSRGCPECGGGGQTFRRFEADDGRNALEDVQLGFTCLCPLGIWIDRHRREANARDASAPVGPCLRDYPDLWEPGLKVPEHPAPPRFPRRVGTIRLHGEPTFVRHLPAWEAAPPPSPVGRRHLAAIGRDANVPF